MQLIHLRTTSELRSMAAAWDDLWLRCETSRPMARAALVAHWVDHFARRRPFQALAVEENGKLVAALPLVTRRVKGLLKVAALPTNAWAGQGDLLLDPAADQSAALEMLLAGVAA